MYVNAGDVLPRSLLREVQKYVQGKQVYIPKEEENHLGWGEANGTKLQLKERNQEIFTRYIKGVGIESLIEEFHMSYDSIRKIIREGRKEQL